ALDDDGFALYEARAINAYIDATLGGPALVPASPRERARMDQWINVCDAYFAPFAQPLIVETLFRQFLGGAVDRAAIDAGRVGISPALDALDNQLADHAYIAGDAFTLADIHWMPYFEYMSRIGHSAAIESRAGLRAWWGRVSERSAWQRAARSGPQPYDPKVAAEVIARLRG
ncbi:MAG TPA: glutathione binding-like protein, partial [Kofleriaceae bacterium]|nr:glutathione binding-like protein [Kofleriaceae bacterium]